MTAKIIPAGERVSLLTAEQIENDYPVLIQDLGKQIAAHYDKLVKCEDKAEQLDRHRPAARAGEEGLRRGRLHHVP
jgi:hypothetical protein